MSSLRISNCCQLLVLALWLTSLTRAEEYQIVKTWDNKTISHDPVIIQLEPIDRESFMILVDAPFFKDPAPPGQVGDPFYGLWDYEVVEVFFLNDNNQYVEIDLSPWGQHIVLLFNDVRKTIRHSLFIDFSVNQTNGRWQGEAIIPKDFLPPLVTKMNAYAIHGVESNRTYESLYPVATGSANEADFHNLKAFQPFNTSIILPEGTSTTSYSITWDEAFTGFRNLEIQHTWNGTMLTSTKASFQILARSDIGLVFKVDAIFNNDLPPSTQSGWPSWPLSSHEVVHLFFFGEDNRYLEVEVGPWGHYAVAFWVNGKSVNDFQDVVQYSAYLRSTYWWYGTVIIPFSYLPPKVSKFNAHVANGKSDSRTIYSLYPQESSAKSPNFHDRKYAKAFDMSMIYPGNDNAQCSNTWTSKQDTGCSSASHALANLSLMLTIAMTFIPSLANQM